MKKDFYFYQAEIREIFSVLIFSLEDKKIFSEKFLEIKSERLEKNLKWISEMLKNR